MKWNFFIFDLGYIFLYIERNIEIVLVYYGFVEDVVIRFLKCEGVN